MPDNLALPRVAAALAAGVPPGPLATVVLPTLRSAGGALVHSRDNADDCRELWLWGWPRTGPRTGSIELTTVAALARDTFSTSTPTLTVCDRCLGEDSDLVEDYAAAAADAAAARSRARNSVAALEAAVARGDHWLPVNADPYAHAQRAPWTLLADLRRRLDPAAAAPGTSPMLDLLTDRLAALDTDLAQWLTDWTGPARLRVRELMATMRDDTAPADQVPTLVVRLGTPAHVAGARTDGFDPAGWLPTFGGPCPVYRMDGPLPDGSAAINLGADPGLDPAALAARLDVTARLAEAAPDGTPLRDLRTAYQAATDLER